MGPISAAAVAALALAAGASSTDSPDPRPLHAREDCSTRSEARFRGAYTNPRNLVVGPLAMIAAGVPTDAQTVREFGGNKFPLLVKAGHKVTVRIARSVRGTAALGYGPLPQGEVRVRDGYRSVTFVACRAGRPTFWSGFVLAREPVCVPLRVFVDGARPPERAEISLGENCDPPEAGG